MPLHEHTVRLGTRSSALALTQSRMVASLLEETHPGLKVELLEIKTTGDVVTDKPLHSFGGAGVFVKELEAALLDGRVDLAVHSLKDVPTAQPEGLAIGAIIGREDPRDAAVVKGRVKLKDLPAGSVIGTGSLRRRAQLRIRYPQLSFAEIRGNVDTRLRKIADGEYAGTILACAGLRRLGLLGKATELIPLSTMLPAPGQGALGIECRSEDKRVLRLLKKVHDPKVAVCVIAERSALQALGGGCHLPLGAFSKIENWNRTLRLRAILALPGEDLCVRSSLTIAITGDASAFRLGQRVAKEMLSNGAREILAKL